MSEMESKKVYAVIGNTDLNEGRGEQYVKTYCEIKATAQRLGYRKYVQGGNCPIESRTLYRPQGAFSWYGPVKVEKPTTSDLEFQATLDQLETALEKARAAGLSDEDIDMIRLGHG